MLKMKKQFVLKNVYILQLKINSFDFNYLNMVSLNLIKIIKNFFLDNEVYCFRIVLPKKSKQITVLKSPHIFKKSRDQFKKSNYNIIIFFKLYNKLKFNFLLYFLKNIVLKLNCTYNLIVKLNKE